MRVTLDVRVELVGSLLFAAVLVCAGACSSGEPVAMTCPAGMASAASQRICVEGLCGNGLRDEEEECDDGNLIDGDGCSSDCQSTEMCGNAIVDHAVGEVCDDGNTSSGDECCGDCRSCPELAVTRGSRGSEKIAVAIEPIALIASEEEPCPVMDAVDNPPAPSHSLPAPLLVRPRAPTPLLDEPRLEETGEVLPPWVMRVLEEARAETENALHRARSEVQARRRLVQAQALLNEELLRAHDMIAEIEQINADLHQYIAGECQQLPSGRGIALH
jgi:cysteine-rich repeat protein